MIDRLRRADIARVHGVIASHVRRTPVLHVNDADVVVTGGVEAWYADQPLRVIGVEPSGAPTLTDALKAGKPVDAPAGSIAADSLAPRRVGELMFPIAQQLVDRALLVDDEEIVRAQNMLWDLFRLVVEPGGAAAFAAILSRRYQPAPDEHVVVVLCGANTERRMAS